MNDTIKSIINGDDENNNNKNQMKTTVERTIELLEELRIEYSHKMENVLTPVLKEKKCATDVLLIPGLNATQKLIMVILYSREQATVKQLMYYIDCTKQTCNTALNVLRNRGLVQKLKMSTYKISETKIF